VSAAPRGVRRDEAAGRTLTQVAGFRWLLAPAAVNYVRPSSRASLSWGDDTAGGGSLWSHNDDQEALG